MKKRAVNDDGAMIGTYDDNPMLNSMLYEVEFADGTVKEYAANVIAESMLTQVDSDGYSTPVMQGIINYKMDPGCAIQKEN